ncbi:MAG: MFS transporter [Cystobacterineae bacterium]|nr:MFS transporter [Cystobacterineae bacterium]
MKRRASLGIIFLVVFVDLLGFGVVVPQLGIYVDKYQGSAFMVGLLMSSYSLMQFLVAPRLGKLSDRIGRKPILLYSLAGFVVANLVFAFADSLAMLFVSRLLAGAAAANIATAQAYVADITSEENRTQGMAIIGAAFGLGFVLGPALGGLLGGLGGNFAIGIASACFSGLSFLLALFFLAEIPEEQRKKSHGKIRWKHWLKMPGFGLALLISVFYTIAFTQMETTFAVFILQKFLAPHSSIEGGLFYLHTHVDAATHSQASTMVGWLFAAIGVVSVFIQGFAIRYFRKYFSEKRLVVLGTAWVALGLALFSLPTQFAWMYLPAILIALGSALYNPSLSALVSRLVPKENYGEALGTYQSMGALGRVLGPLLGGFLYTRFCPSATYFVAAGMVFLVCLGALRLPRLRSG